MKAATVLIALLIGTPAFAWDPVAREGGKIINQGRPRFSAGAVGGGTASDDATMRMMLTIKKEALRDSREDHKIKAHLKKEAMRAKNEKLQLEQKNIAAEKKEADERYSAAAGSAGPRIRPTDRAIAPRRVIGPVH